MTEHTDDAPTAPRTVHLFAEDEGLGAFVRALVERLARAAALPLAIEDKHARGGRPRLEQELRLYVQAIQHTDASPDLLVVAADANCKGRAAMVRTFEKIVADAGVPHVAYAVADPHVERWYMADPNALQQQLGARVTPGRKKCEKDFYKKKLREALRDAEHEVRLGGAEYAHEIVQAMDLYRAGKNDSSLAAFINEARNHLKRLA